MPPRTGCCPDCREAIPLRRFFRAGTLRWHDLITRGGVYRCPGSGEPALGMVTR
jgi:hypothetical protein